MITIVSDITGKDYKESEKLLKESNFVIRDAIDNSEQSNIIDSSKKSRHKGTRIRNLKKAP